MPRPPWPPRREPAITVADEIGEQLVVGPVDDRALGHVDDEIVAAHAVLLLARAVRARGRLAVRVIAEREQRGDVAARPQPDVATPAAVAAVGTAPRHVRLAAERDTARAAVATFQVALRYVDEAGHRRQDTDRPRSGRPYLYDLCVRLPRLASIAMIAALVLLTACSSNNPPNRPPPSSTTTSSTSSTTSTTSVPTTTLHGHLRPVSALGGPRIVSLTGPATPVQCNAPTSVELHWETRGAQTVTLRIDRRADLRDLRRRSERQARAARVRRERTRYTLTARAADGRTATRSLTITERA